MNIWPTNKQALRELEMFINPRGRAATQLAKEWDHSKVSDSTASHSSLGKKFGRNAGKLHRRILQYLPYDLYSAVISSFSGNGGKERVDSGCRN